MTITTGWAVAIDDYIAHVRLAGYPASTQKMRREHLQYLARRAAADPWTITGEQLLSFVLEQDWSASTKRSRRTSYQAFFRWAKHTKRRKGDPSKDLPAVRQPGPKPRPMPERVYREAFMRAPAEERVWLELAWDHGLRREEIAKIHTRDLFEDFVGWSLVVHGKGDRDRVVPLTPHMAQVLTDLSDLDPGYLFKGDVGGHISPEWLGKRANRLFEGDWTIHKCRHAAGTKWNRKGGLLVAQKLLGHASVATTQIYCDVASDDLRDTLLATAS